MDSFKQKISSAREGSSQRISAAREGGVRNQVTGMFSRDKPTQQASAARPINELRDPASFEPPPRRRTVPLQPPAVDTQGARPPAPSSRPAPSPPISRAGTKPPPPALPPRLPPRSNPASPVSPSNPDPYLNQSAVSRLGAAGISIPDLGISNNASSPSPSTTPQGTTWAQKRAALHTVNDFHKDPSSVSLQDARGAASTANSFKQRHGEQAAVGARAANGLNQKYGIAERVAGYSAPGEQGGGAGRASPLGGLAGKKAPPPPPPKRGGGGAAGSGGPPPLPLGTKPRFS